MYDSVFYRKPDAPCKGCSDRFLGCHGCCQKYADWVREEKTITDKILSEKATENLKKETEIKLCIKRKKERTRWKKN